MNVLEVQEALKDFSQEQLIKEMQMPSGQAPQFLVLSELNRRQRMKQDFEARQAQQQPTVAEKLVAAAGAPQGGIGAMAQSMAPQTDMAMNTGISQMREPMSGEVMAMREGGRLDETVLQRQERMKDIPFPQFRDSQGNLKYTYGDPNNPFLNEEGQKGGSILGMGAKYLKDQLAGKLGRGGGSTVMAPPAEVSMSEMDIPEGDESTGLRSILSALASGGGERQADATTSEELGEPLRLNVGGSTTPIYGGSTGNPNPSFFDRLITGLTPSNFGKSYRDLYGIPPGPSSTFGEGKLGIDPATGRRFQDDYDVEEAYRRMTGLKPAGASDEETETIRDRIMDLMEQRQKSADMDKYLALAQAGFTLMQPTEGGFGEALGKAGVAGIQAYQDASDRYQTGLADVLDTEIALQKAAASGETSLDRIKTYTDALKAISDIQADDLGGVDYSSDIESLRTRIMSELSGRGTVDLGSLSN